ncbi:MAG: hypothetical protein HY652_08885 [Acidobacteria bacterium]|nr:hypothetical protein [Acidobacteriota bacterium]
MTLDEQLNRLENWIRRVKIEYDIFFAGASKRPPFDLVSKIESTIKSLAENMAMSYAQRFRYNTLTANYYAHRDLWRRTFREKEEGGRLRNEEELYGLIGGKAPSEIEDYLRIECSEPDREIEKIEELYEFFVTSRKKRGEEEVPLERFCQFIKQKTPQLKQKFHSHSVFFEVKVTKEGVRLVARPPHPVKTA